MIKLWTFLTPFVLITVSKHILLSQSICLKLKIKIVMAKVLALLRWFSIFEAKGPCRKCKLPIIFSFEVGVPNR